MLCSVGQINQKLNVCISSLRCPYSALGLLAFYQVLSKKLFWKSVLEVVGKQTLTRSQSKSYLKYTKKPLEGAISIKENSTIVFVPVGILWWNSKVGQAKT